MPGPAQQVVAVVRDNIEYALKSLPAYSEFKIGYNKTPEQRARGKVIGACCGFVTEKGKAKFAGITAELKFRPNRVVACTAGGEIVAIRIDSNFENARVGMEFAAALEVDHQILQRYLDEWLA